MSKKLQIENKILIVIIGGSLGVICSLRNLTFAFAEDAPNQNAAIIEPPPMPHDKTMSRPAPVTGDDINKRPTSEAAEAIYRNDYQFKKRQQLGQLSLKIFDFRRKISQLAQKDKKQAHELSHMAVKKYNIAHAQLKNIEASSVNTWYELKPPLEESIEKLENILRQVK